MQSKNSKAMWAKMSVPKREVILRKILIKHEGVASKLFLKVHSKDSNFNKLPLPVQRNLSKQWGSQ